MRDTEGNDLGVTKDHLKARNPNHELLQEISLDPDDYHYLAILHQLNRSRPYAEGNPLNIPLSAYIDYQNLFDTKLGKTDITILQQIDDAYLDKVYEDK